MADCRTQTQSEVDVNKRHSGLIDSAVLLKDLVRVLARSAACEAFGASLIEKDNTANDYKA